MPGNRFDPTGQAAPARSRWHARRLNQPNSLWGSNGVAFGPDGRLYVAQFLAGQISAVDPSDGDVEIVVPLDSPVHTPDDLAFGADGSMYIADLAPGRVWRRDEHGEYDLVSDTMRRPNGITCIGDRLFVNEMRPGGALFEMFPREGTSRLLTDGLAWGNAMQLGPDGYLYYPHMMTQQVWRVCPDRGQPELVAEEVDHPVAVRFDRAGALVVLSCGPLGLITRINLATGERSVRKTGIPGLDNAAFDDENRMFLSSFAHGGISEVHEDGRTREVVRKGLNGPFGLATDRRGTVYATDHFSLVGVADADEISSVDLVTGGLPIATRSISADGELLQLSTMAGELHEYDPRNKTSRTRARELGALAGIAVGPDREVVLACPDRGQVLRIDQADIVEVLAEGLEHPVGVALDESGTCYITDDRRGQVLRLFVGQKPELLADGLGGPQGITAHDGNVFVVEVANQWLRRIPLSGATSEVVAAELAVVPPVISHDEPPSQPGVSGQPDPFADVAVAPDGALLVSANGEGSVVRLGPTIDA